jgi:hypothetical protein
MNSTASLAPSSINAVERAAQIHRIRANMSAEYIPVNSLHGRLYYANEPPIENTGPFCARGERINETGVLRLPLPAEQVIDLCTPKRSLRGRLPRKASTKKLKRIVSAASLRDSSNSTAADQPRAGSSTRASSRDMSTDRNNPRPESALRHERPYLHDELRSVSGTSVASSTTQTAPAMWAPQEKPVASGNGVAMSIALAEPFIFLQGFEQQDVNVAKTTMLRGSLIVRVSKPSKLKSISLRFRGRATTDWPEGMRRTTDVRQ